MRLLLVFLVLSSPALARSHHKKGDVGGSCPASCTSGKRLFPEGKAPDAVDAEVLKLCPADPSKSVEPAAIRAFFEKHLDDGRLAQAVASAAPFAKTKAEKAKWLTNAWSGPARRNAFTHVLCGDDWDKPKLGGLHLESRYAQLEDEGKLCFTSGDCDKGQCVIRYRGVQGFSCGTKAVGGFAQGLDALDLLAAGTRAYLGCCMGGAPATSDEAGRLRDGGRYAGPNGITFQIWCGARNGQPGIATFYPIDGTANCR
jgi:hypothetical protein